MALKGKDNDFKDLLTLSEDAQFAKTQAETELRSYETQLDKSTAVNSSLKNGSLNTRLFANHDDSINVL